MMFSEPCRSWKRCYLNDRYVIGQKVLLSTNIALMAMTMVPDLLKDCFLLRLSYKHTCCWWQFCCLSRIVFVWRMLQLLPEKLHLCVCAAVSFKIANCVITVALELVLWRINQQWQGNTLHIQWPSLWFIQKQTEQTKVKQQFNTFYVCGLWWFIQTQTCTLLLLLMKIKIKTQTKAKIEIRRCAYTVPNALGLARLTLVVSG